MAYSSRGRRIHYDNIAAGSVAGFEHTIVGDTVTYLERPGGGYRTSTSTGEVWQSNITAGVSTSNDIADGTVAGGALAENIVQAAVTNTEERVVSDA